MPCAAGRGGELKRAFAAWLLVLRVQVDLGGGLRPVRSLDLRVVELAKLGLQEIIVPDVSPALAAAVEREEGREGKGREGNAGGPSWVLAPKRRSIHACRCCCGPSIARPRKGRADAGARPRRVNEPLDACCSTP